MKTTIRLLTPLALVLGFSAQAGAYTVDGGGTEVGGLDTVLDSDTGINGDSAELDFINAAAGTSFTSLDKEQNVTWQTVDGETDIIAFMLTSEPGYYLVKNSTYTAAVQNDVELGWGVLDLNDPDLADFGGSLGDDFQISHVSSFGGGGTSVPEPATLSLLGAGLVAFGLSRRRTRRRVV